MTDEEIIQRALAIIEQRMVVGYSVVSQHDLIRHAGLRLADERREVLLAYWLNAEKRLIVAEELAIGSNSSLTYDSRYVMRRAVVSNAEFAIFAHNHPDGNSAASDCDRKAAESINWMLATIGVLVLGHYTIGAGEVEEIITGERGSFRIGCDDGRARCPNCNFLLEQ